MVFRSPLPVFSCILFLPLIQASSNVTVDSSDHAITYSPPNSWTAQGWDNQTTSPDTQQASEGTWQYASTDAVDDTTSENNVTLSLTFDGIALYVFAILQSEIFTAVDFAINGTHVGSYSRIPDTTANFIYNATVYENSSLPQGKHSFTLSLSQTDRSAFFFDYLIYSAGDQVLVGPDGSSTPPTASTLATVTSAPTPVPFSNAPEAPLTLGNTTTISTASETSISETPVTTLSSVAGVSTQLTSQANGPTNRSAGTSSTTSSRSNVIVIIAAAAGSGAVVLILLLFVVCYIRYKRTKKYHIEPYVTPDATPTNTPNDQDIFTKLPPSTTSSTRPFLARLSFQTFAESTATGITLTDEIFPLPSDVEEVYSQLEALSVEVQKFREADEDGVPEEHRFSRRVHAVTQDVHASIDQLRMEIQRLRRRSGTGTGTGTGITAADADLMHMLREVDILRAELHEAVGQTDSDSSIERLPSYHSRKTVRDHPAHEETPPPLPTSRQVYVAASKSRA